MKIRNYLTLTLIISTLNCCSLDPEYKKPKSPIKLNSAQEEVKQLSEVGWDEYFLSPDLQRIIQLSLDNNKDLRTAALNVEIARATHGIAKADLLPEISASASTTRQGVPSAFSRFMPKNQFRANVGFTSYELDFFGRLRSLKKSAFEDYLATVENENIAKIAIIAETANAYAQLLLDYELLKLAKENLKIKTSKYESILIRRQNGIDSEESLLDAIANVENAKLTVESYEENIFQDKNALRSLTGIFIEESMPKDRELGEILIAEHLLNFVPSETLLERPDIKKAEHDLKNANANIGAARAAFFPSISLSGSYGYGSTELNKLWSSRFWSFTPQINIPIFSGGRNTANLDIANARKKIQILAYEKAIQDAFRETLDVLATRKSVFNRLESQNKIFEARSKSFELSQEKFKKGVLSSIDIANIKSSLLTAKANQIIAEKEYINNLITLYKVMGGSSDTKREKVRKKRPALFRIF